MNFEKAKITIFWSGDNTGLTIKEGTKIIHWESLSREEQVKILNALAGMHNLFGRFLKEE